MLKLKILRLGDYLGLPRWAQCSNHKGLYLRRKQEGQSQRRCDSGSRVQREIWRCPAAGFEDGGEGLQAKGCGQPLEAGKVKDTLSSLEPLEEMQPCGHILDCDLQNGKIINLHSCYSSYGKQPHLIMQGVVWHFPSPKVDTPITWFTWDLISRVAPVILSSFHPNDFSVIISLKTHRWSRDMQLHLFILHLHSSPIQDLFS